MPLEGGSIMSTASANPDAASLPLEATLEGNIVIKRDPDPSSFFYGDLSAEEGAYRISRLRPHAAATFGDPLKYAAWRDIPTWYLFALRDMAVPIDVQRKFVQDARAALHETEGQGTGRRRITTDEVDSDHSPFLCRPGETAAFIERATVSGLKRSRLKFYDALQGLEGRRGRILEYD